MTVVSPAVQESDLHEVTFDPERLEAWLHDLETTDAPQCNGILADYKFEGPTAYCCLGRLAVVAGINDGGALLLTADMVEWLVNDGERILLSPSGADLVLDVPDNERDRWGLVARKWETDVNYGADVRYLSASGLNDKHCQSFTEIAATIREYGLRGWYGKEVPVS